MVRQQLMLTWCGAKGEYVRMDGGAMRNAYTELQVPGPLPWRICRKLMAKYLFEFHPDRVARIPG